MSIYVSELKQCKICLEWKTMEAFLYNGDSIARMYCYDCRKLQIKSRTNTRRELFKLNILRHPPMGKCIKCDEYLPSHYFDANYANTTGLYSICKYHAALRSIINKAKKKSIAGIDEMMPRRDYFGKLDGVCYYCGTKEHIGVDRIDSSVGYTKANCISCCTTCNMMKRNMNIAAFINQCKRIAAYQKISFI